MLLYLAIATFIVFALLWILHVILKRKGKEKSILFYAGLYYILLFLPLIFSLYIYIASGFIITGIIFLLLSYRISHKGFQFTLSPLPLFILIFVMIYTDTSKNIFLIPEGFTGRIVVIHGCKNGEAREYEGTYRLYRIKPDGLLKTRFSFAGNAFDSLHSKYFYVDAAGNRKQIFENQGGIHPHGLWTLPYQRNGETIIDFILDTEQKNPYDYKKEEFEKLQKEIDSCK